MVTVLILGSGPQAMEASSWPSEAFSEIVVINNAWRVRPDWSYLIYPEDFPEDRRPTRISEGQQIVTANQFVPAQNCLGGFVFAGGTMAFTASYWALHQLKPSAIFYFGCDMVYPKEGPSHFYGYGTADPLRPDITLRSLEAKSCRFRAFAARHNCAVFNLSAEASRLSVPRARLEDVHGMRLEPPIIDGDRFEQIVAMEKATNYFVESGRYWEHSQLFDVDVIDRIDRQWLDFFPSANP